MLWDAPELWLTLLAITLLLAEAFGNLEARLIGRLTVLGTFCILLATLISPVPSYDVTYWSGLYTWDPEAKFFKVFFLVVSLLVSWMSLEFEPHLQENQAEFYILPLLVTAGMCVLASAADFMVLFVGLELVTISFYILVAFQRHNALALEAGVKYLILGGLSSAFLIMGIAYLFGLTGSTQFTEIAAALSTLPHATAPLAWSILFLLVGLGFKIASVPFHLWAPDVYQGAPTPITAFLSVGSKAVGFVILIRVLQEVLPSASESEIWIPILTLSAIASLLLGNLAAIPQRSLKRMLAYSSIGHTGFLLIGVLAMATSSTLLQETTSSFSPGQTGRVAVALYLITYLLANMSAFLVLTIVSQKISRDTIPAYAGLWQRSPLLAGSLAVALVSLAGIPPTVGFMGKLAIFSVAWANELYLLFWIGVASALFGLYYYLGVVKSMFWSEPLDFSPIPVSTPTAFLLSALILATFLLGIWGGGLAHLVLALS